MNQQLEFFARPPQKPAKYGVFLAIFPDSFTAGYISEMANQIKAKHGLHGRVRPLNHLHVSLLPLGGCSEVSEQVFQFIDKICAAITANQPPFDVEFDRAFSYQSGKDTHPFVLSSTEDKNAALKSLRRALVLAFSRYLPRSVGSKFTPHVTLLYDKQSIPERLIEPVRWKVSEIVLVLSEVNMTKYERRGCWKLGE